MNASIATVASATTFQIDKAHSDASFSVRHLLTRVRGHFSEMAGTIAFDEADPASSAVDIRIQAASVNTNQPDRDAHLRSEDFFAADRFPDLTFVSQGITKTGQGSYLVRGALTIRGVEKVIDLPVTFLGTATDPWGNRKIAFEAETTINRKEYGLNWNAALEAGGFLVGDEVQVTLSVQATAA